MADIEKEVVEQQADKFAGAMFIASAESEGELVAGDDGYVVYWPKGCHGAFTAWTLRLFADELDRRNAVWDAQVQAALSSKETER
jgi:hypothetical protein